MGEKKTFEPTSKIYVRCMDQSLMNILFTLCSLLTLSLYFLIQQDSALSVADLEVLNW